MAFHEVRFPEAIGRGARCGPERRTQVVELASGDEERNASWANSRRRYDVSYGIRRADDLAAVVAFFEARNGRLHGFRFRDWSDYRSGPPSQTPSPLDQTLGTGDGTTTAFQLTKRYPSGAQASVQGVGCDCLGLARGVWRDVVGPEPFPIPPYSRDWGETGPVEVLAEGTRTAMIEIAPAEAGPGALLLFQMRPGAIAKHVGIVTTPERFIHAYERLGVEEEPLTPAWRRRIAFAFLFPRLKYNPSEGRASEHVRL